MNYKNTKNKLETFKYSLKEFNTEKYSSHMSG